MFPTIAAEKIQLLDNLPKFRMASPAPATLARAAGTHANGNGPSAVIDGEAAEVRAWAWLAKRDPAISGQGGRKHTASTASALVIDFGLPLDEAWAMIAEWNTTNVPPWPADQLREILDWANGQPGQRGSKIAETAYTGSSRDREDLAWLDTLEAAIRMRDFTQHMGPGGKTWLSFPPKTPPISQEELDHLGGEAITTTVIQVRDHHHRNGCYPAADPYPDHPDHLGQDWTPAAEQIQTPPPLSDKYVYEHDPACTCSFLVLLVHVKDPRGRFLRLPGRKWDCPKCGPARRRHYKATMIHWLADWTAAMEGDPDAKLYTTIVAAADWKKIGSIIRVNYGSFFRIDHQAMGTMPGGSYRVVSTVPAGKLAWEEIAPDKAAILLSTCIDAMPDDIRVRVWWSSRDWKLLPDGPKKEKEWTTLGSLKTPIADVLEVLDDYDIIPKRILAEGRFFGWTGHEFTFRESDRSDLFRDIGLGFAASLFARQIGANVEDGPLNGDGCSVVDNWFD